MKAWVDFLDSLCPKLGREAVNHWLKPIEIVRFDAANLTLRATPFQRAWFDEHVKPYVGSLFNNNQRPIKIHWEATTFKHESTSSTPKYQISPDPLDPELLFEHFIAHPHVEMAANMSSELIANSTSSFNPIFFYGNKGVGKTHLLVAIAHALQKKNRTVFYVKAQTFMEHVVNAIRLGLMQEFRKEYREIDVLLIDDIHRLERKNATQEEFFHTFNALHTLNCPIILSAHAAPSHLLDIEPRLISRFEWGIAIEMHSPLEQDLLRILREKAKSIELDITNELLTFIAQKFTSSLQAAVEALHLLSIRAQSIKTIEQAKWILADLLEKEAHQELTPERILKLLAAHYGIKTEDLTGKSQMREYAQPRQAAMYLCRKRLQMPLQSIGRFFHRDHTTVMSSIRQVEKALQDPSSAIATGIRSVERKIETQSF